MSNSRVKVTKKLKCICVRYVYINHGINVRAQILSCEVTFKCKPFIAQQHSRFNFQGEKFTDISLAVGDWLKPVTRKLIFQRCYDRDVG